jgi:hypothetical protein
MSTILWLHAHPFYLQLVALLALLAMFAWPGQAAAHRPRQATRWPSGGSVNNGAWRP